MNRNVIITCAVTGSGDSASKTPHLPISPKEIADASIEAAKAGAAIAHIHVREADGSPSRRLELYNEVVSRIRESETDVIINLTTGMGGDIYLGPDSDPLQFGDETDFVGQMERIKHVELLLPEICSLDCGSFNYVMDDYVYVSTPGMLRIGASKLLELGVKPELEVFDLGHVAFANQLIKEEKVEAPPFFQIVQGVKWGAAASTRNFQTMIDNLPDGANYAGFGVGSMQMPMVAQSILLGGNVGVGLEDNLYLEKGVLGNNAQMVERAASIIENMGASIQTPAEARTSLNLKKQESEARIES